MKRLREQYHKNREIFGAWQEKTMQFIAEECLQQDGKIIVLKEKEIQGYLLCYPRQNCVWIKEMVLPCRLAQQGIKAAMQTFCVPLAQLRLPADTLKKENKPFAMAHFLDNTLSQRQSSFTALPAYLTDVLD